MTNLHDNFLQAFSAVNTRQRMALGYKTQYKFAECTRWHRKQWSRYESPLNMKLLTVCELAHCLQLTGSAYLRKVADEMERLEQQDNSMNY